MITVQRFILRDFLNKVIDREGDLTEVFYTFRNSGSSGFIRQIQSFDQKGNKLIAIDMSRSRLMAPERDFFESMYQVDIRAYRPGGSALLNPKGVLITFYQR